MAVVFYNDHGLNFFLDKLPTFAVGAASEYQHADEGWGLPVARPYPGDPAFSWHLIESLVADEFDVTMCQDMLVDHAFTIPLALLWPGADARPVRTIPIEINTVQHPLPSPARCLKLGQAVGRAIESYGQDCRVLVVGTGGLSHQLDGTRAGFINKKFDLMCLQQMVDEPEALTRLSISQLIEQAGTPGRGAAELDRHARRADRPGVQGSHATTTSRFPTPPRRSWCSITRPEQRCARRGDAAAGGGWRSRPPPRGQSAVTSRLVKQPPATSPTSRRPRRGWPDWSRSAHRPRSAR